MSLYDSWKRITWLCRNVLIHQFDFSIDRQCVFRGGEFYHCQGGTEAIALTRPRFTVGSAERQYLVIVRQIVCVILSLPRYNT